MPASRRAVKTEYRAERRELLNAGIAPDDLRHTYARLAYNAGIPPTLIRELLGQGDIATTYHFIGLNIDLDGITGDFVPLSAT